MQILIVPGAGCSYPHVKDLSARLRGMGLSVRVVTLPEHQLGKNPGGKRLHDYVSHVASEVSDPDTIIVGHSMGGLIAQEVAELDPRVKGIVLIASAVSGVRCLSYRALFRMAPRLRYSSAMAYGYAFEFHPDDLRALFYNGRESVSAGEFVLESGAALLDLAVGQFRSPERSREVKACVIAAEEDALIPRHAQERLADDYDCALNLVEDAPHMLCEGPFLDDITKIMLSWLWLEFPEKILSRAAE